MTSGKKLKAGKRAPRVNPNVALFNDKGEWVGYYDKVQDFILTTQGNFSGRGTKAHEERQTAAFKWIAENDPAKLAAIVQQLFPEAKQEDVQDEAMAD